MNRYQNDVVTLNLQSDFYEKWAGWINDVNQLPKDLIPLTNVKTEYGWLKDFYFSGCNHAKIYGRLFFNEKAPENHPLVLLYHGVGAVTHTEGYEKIASYWLDAGFSVLGMDVRLQGGMTVDGYSYSHQEFGHSAFDILNPDTYYNKLLYQDALKLINVASDIPEIRGKALIVTGGSQGGALALAAAALSPKVALCLCDIPSGCYLPGRVKGRHGSYSGVERLIKQQPELEQPILKTLSYTDIVNMARDIKCPVLGSVGALDQTCPPTFFYQAYRMIPSPKDLFIFEGYGHGGYDEAHMENKFNFIRKYLK
jgi:cephalosporin-C deacetylase